MALSKLCSRGFCLLIISSLVGSEFIDLTHIFNNKTIYWGNSKRFQHKVVHQGKISEDISYFSSFDFSGNEHGGTHLDAPVHFAEGKWSVDEIPIQNLVGPGIVVDISLKCLKDRNAELIVDDLHQWEKEYGRIPDGGILLVFTGWGKFWPNYENYMGTNTSDSSLYQYPGIHKDASEWLVKNRKLNGVGIDTASLDPGKSTNLPSHQILLRNNIFGLENVANLDKVPAIGSTIYAFPMLIGNGSGAPVRLIAKVGNEQGHLKSEVFLRLVNYFCLIVIVAHFIYVLYTHVL